MNNTFFSKVFAFVMLTSSGLFSLPVLSQEIVSFSYSKEAFPLVQNGQAAPLFIDTLDAKVVEITASLFCNDINLVTGVKPLIFTNNNEIGQFPVIVGTIGKSSLIDQLVATKKIPSYKIAGKWENYMIAVVDKPIKGIKKALVIAGSDRRGTAYGLIELSRMIGVSPWVWWADVLPTHRDAIYIKSDKPIIDGPTIKYRGIFLNDEDWGLKPWAAKNWDSDIEDIGPKAYAKIFELMLRLKSNYLWPAMHDCTKAFYFYPDNPKVADEYAIVVGSSHCEPILRNNVFEWTVNFKNEYGYEHGEWRYDLNKEQIHKYWNDRAKQSSNYESVYTIGMRGVHDGSMPGPKDVNEKIKLLDTVISHQRLLLSDNLHKFANQIPQIFCPYKEVLTLYQRGLDLPDDITIVWADDNHGYVRQLSTPQEQKRSGSSGVYYHISYWGSPHDYLWLSSISPSLISYELTKAYQYGADRLWIINVGDIKPAELETEFAMDLAWNINKWTPQNAFKYSKYWAVHTFGDEFADSIADIKNVYCQLAQAGKPEHLGLLTFSAEEMKKRLNAYQSIANKAERLNELIPDRLKDAYFQLVYYPVKGAYLMNQKIFYARMSLDLVKGNNRLALDYSAKSKDAFNQIQIMTKIYNEEIANGKWNGMMSWNPRYLEVFKMPKVATEVMVIDSVVQNHIKISENKNIISIAASEFSEKLNKQNTLVEHFPLLGLDGTGIGIVPFTAGSIKDTEIANATNVLYKITPKPGEYTVTVKCLPTHTIYKGRSLRYAISVNNDSLQVIDINSPAESAQWKKNVLRGYSEGKTKHRITAEKADIRIYFPDPGVVINRIEVE